MLWKDAKNCSTVGRIIDIFTSKEVIDEDIHLSIAEQLTIGNGSMAGQGESHVSVDIDIGIYQQLLKESYGLQPINTSRNTIDSIAGWSELSQLETSGSKRG